MLPVPADGGFRVLPSDTFVPVGMTGLTAERKIDGPVMGQTDLPPGTVVEFVHRGGMAVIGRPCFGEVGKILRSMGMVPFPGGSIPQGEQPAVIQKDRLGPERRQWNEKGRPEKEKKDAFHGLSLPIVGPERE